MPKPFGVIPQIPALSATPSGNPPTGALLLYFKGDGFLYQKDSGGTESKVDAGGSVAYGTTAELADVDGAAENAGASTLVARADHKHSIASDAAAGTASLRTLGTGALQAAAGDDSRLTPTGVVLPYAGATAPTGYLLCDGANYTNAAYPALAAVLGTTFGGVSGTNFNVPDMRARIPVGVGTGRALGSNDAVAEASRAANHDHAHTHTATTTNTAITAGTPAGTNASVSAGTPDGSNTAVTAGTPAGNNTAVTAGTPAGTIPSHPSHTHNTPLTTTGLAGSHAHGITGQASGNTWNTPNTGTNVTIREGTFNLHNHGGATGTESDHNHGLSSMTTGGPSATLSHAFTGTELPTHDHAFTGTALPTHNHTWTGTALPTHGHTFTGTALPTHNHTAATTVASGGDPAHPYLALNYIVKT